MSECRDNRPACPLCGRELRRFRSSKQWLYFRCVKDGYWTARDLDGGWPSFEYSDAADFERGRECPWATVVAQACAIMRHKFRLGHMRRGTFLDIGCAEAAYVAGSAALGWTASGVEIDEAKVARAGAGAGCAPPQPAVGGGQSAHRGVRDASACSRARSGLCRICQGRGVGGCPGRHSVGGMPQSSGAVGAFQAEPGAGRSVSRRLYPPTHVHAFEPKAFRRLGEQIGMTCERIITYPAWHPDWWPPQQSGKSRSKRILHQCAAALGYGNSITAVYRKNAGEADCAARGVRFKGDKRPCHTHLKSASSSQPSIARSRSERPCSRWPAKLWRPRATR